MIYRPAKILNKLLVINILSYLTPSKKKVLRANNAPDVTKELSKANIKTSQLENLYLEKLTDKSLKAYNKQKKYVSGLYENKEKYFLMVKPINCFRKQEILENCKISFTHKTTFVENGKIIDKSTDIGEELNNFFKNTVDSLNI